MIVISLNIWGGRAGKEKVLDFFKKYRDEADVFCLQEVWRDAYKLHEGALAGGVPINHENIMTHALQEISAVLPDHVPYFRPSFLEDYGLCTFVHKKYEVIEEGDVFVHRERGFMPEGDVGFHGRNLQYVTIARGESALTFLNFHGLWNGKGKGDSDDRLAQSDRITAFVESRDGPIALCGDFNLTPDTESLKKIGAGKLKNLIREYGITSTRTNLYTKPERYADYVFVSEGVEVKDFKVLPDEPSDHAPLCLEIS